MHNRRRQGTLEVRGGRSRGSQGVEPAAKASSAQPRRRARSHGVERASTAADAP
ncbi:hypothetical protein PJP07_23965 [Mycobacterium kansasii]